MARGTIYIQMKDGRDYWEVCSQPRINKQRSFSVVVRRKRSKDKVRQEKKYEALEAEFFRFLATNGGGVA